MDRLEVICSRLPRCRVLADVGCDHGYATAYALRSGLCGRAYACDVSAASLKKAETLLQEEIAAGRCVPVCTDGLDGVSDADCVLIAGMGGEEIVGILSRVPLPERFVLQPMRNTEKVRRFLVDDLIAGSGGGGDCYTDFEFRYGRDNLRAPGAAFLKKMRREADVVRQALSSAKEERDTLLARLHETEAIIDAIEERL